MLWSHLSSTLFALIIVIIAALVFRCALASTFFWQIEEFQKSSSPKRSLMREVIIDKTSAPQFRGKMATIRSVDSYDSQTIISLLHKSIHCHVKFIPTVRTIHEIVGKDRYDLVARVNTICHVVSEWFSRDEVLVVNTTGQMVFFF